MVNEGTQEERLNKALSTLAKTRYDLSAMETLFTLEAEELSELQDNPETFQDADFLNIARFVFRELNFVMSRLGMHDKDQADKIRFNQNFIDNSNAITTEILTRSAQRDIAAIHSLTLILHDYLSPYANKIKEIKTNVNATTEKRQDPKDVLRPKD